MQTICCYNYVRKSTIYIEAVIWKVALDTNKDFRTFGAVCSANKALCNARNTPLESSREMQCFDVWITLWNILFEEKFAVKRVFVGWTTQFLDEHCSFGTNKSSSDRSAACWKIDHRSSTACTRKAFRLLIGWIKHLRFIVLADLAFCLFCVRSSAAANSVDE
jgi:hypothetical protein